MQPFSNTSEKKRRKIKKKSEPRAIPLHLVFVKIISSYETPNVLSTLGGSVTLVSGAVTRKAQICSVTLRLALTHDCLLWLRGKTKQPMAWPWACQSADEGPLWGACATLTPWCSDKRSSAEHVHLGQCSSAQQQTPPPPFPTAVWSGSSEKWAHIRNRLNL